MRKIIFTSILGGLLVIPTHAKSEEPVDIQKINIPGIGIEDLKIPGINISEDMLLLMEYYGKQGFPSEEQFKEMSFKFQRNRLVSKAPTDGCFYNIGDTRNSYLPLGMTESECAECENSGGVLKHNQSYVWGLTNDENNIFWGTNFNYVCTGRVEVTLKSVGKLEGFEPYFNDCVVCEFDKAASGFGENLNKDWRPPRIYRYDKKTGRTKDITPDTEKDPNIVKAFGLRSAGTYQNHTVIAGPNSQDHISMYWYDNSLPFDQEGNGYIGSWTMKHLPGFENKVPFNIRRWIVANDDMYCAIEYVNKGQTDVQRGAILRWKKEIPFDIENDGGDPSRYFEVVGWTAGGAGDLCLMNDRIYVSTMPSMQICQGPKMEGKRLPKVTDETDKPWPSVFNYMSYDPDPICKSAVAGGALHAYKGKLYFGTMHIPMQFALFAPRYYGDKVFENPESILKAILGTQRASAVFRLTENEDGSTHTDLLYGETELPAFNFMTKKWEIKPTNMTPLYGKSGFNNAWNNYTWAMSEMNDKLYVGTQDWTCMWVPMLRVDIPLPDQAWSLLGKLLKETNLSGYDVYCFEDNENAAKIVTTNGFNVPSSYGVRNMVNDGKSLYIGSASGHNLAETGGWEVVELTDKLPLVVPDIRWQSKKVSYGENWKEELPNAVAKAGFMNIPGSYNYSVNHTPLQDIDKLLPGSYNLRVNFTPQNTQIYKPESSKIKIDIDKAVLDVVGENVEVIIGEETPNQLGYQLEGFVYDDNAEVLTEKPVAKLDTIPNGPGVYDIKIAGGKSDLYDFNYINGTLILKVPSAISEAEKDATRLYPIPFKDNIYVESESPVKSIEVADLSGALVFRVDQQVKELDLSKLKSGVYLITIVTEEGKISRKVTKE
ncbi:MAG: T9SS type A sorting domain-containing protein [Bacteroidales bacterium]